ncbi:MAG: SRPBCC family protein, partial [Pseudomonadota bacterium]
PEQNGFVHTCIGEAVVGFKGFTERFATHVRSNRATTTVDVALARGPFRTLQNTWTLSPISSGSELHFYLDYDFSNPVLKALAASNSAIAIDKIMSAFLTEAEKRYTPVSIA